MAKILLVEDDKSLREIYGVRLMAEGYEIVSAGDGEEALAMAIKERPDLIVSDVMMPKISGFDMLDILRSTTETKDVKVIMMTALSSDDQRARGEALGADRYLVKSQVGIEDVVRTVHDVLGDSIAPAAPAMPSFGPVGIPTAPAPAPETQPVFEQATPAPESEPAFAPAPPQFETPAPAPAAFEPAPAPAPQPAFEQPAPAPQAFVPTPVETPVSVPAPEPFTQPAPMPTGEPAFAPAPPQFETPAPAPAAFEPAPQPMQQFTPQAAPAPTPTPFTAPVPTAPASAVLSELPTPPAPVMTSMPQPTAPFSTPAPASLGERIIEPLTNPTAPSTNDIASQIEQALSAQTPPTQGPPPVPPAA